jgi:hypothetical protein
MKRSVVYQAASDSGAASLNEEAERLRVGSDNFAMRFQVLRVCLKNEPVL